LLRASVTLDKAAAKLQKRAMQFAAVIVAAGAGRRAGGETPKQWRSLAGKPVALWSAEALSAAGADPLVAVVSAEDAAVAAEVFAGLPRMKIVTGGAERIDSVRAGLEALRDHAPEAVLIHDAARPFVTSAHVEALLQALETTEAALPALLVSDTLKHAGADRIVSATPEREGLWRAQTPQAFRYAAVMDAYAAWPAAETPTDDAAVLERAGGRVTLTAGDPMLMKLTYPEDFPMAEALAGAARVVRVGQGVDAHRFGEGNSVWLCGVEIPHDQTLIGHSDADAGLHALTDAILGAIGEGDIGDHFPPTDPQWKGAASDKFLLHAVELVRRKGGRILNADVTLICEQPKIKPHRAAMRARLAELLDLPLDRVSVKATTMEEMGFTGRREGLAAQAIAAVETMG
jgi:2-C-methyl-D-erythritol 4-phosphate cytidylyltransferase / 2-C-methyl-D-erythritol 2,4-cyclodiphosphate synthase